MPNADLLPTVPGGGIDLEGGFQLHGETAPTRLGYVAGVLNRARLVAFERVVFRATRGNMFLSSADITQQVSKAL